MVGADAQELEGPPPVGPAIAEFLEELYERDHGQPPRG